MPCPWHRGGNETALQSRRRTNQSATPEGDTLKGGNAPKDARRRNSSDATHKTEMARVIRERDEALEQQRAISDVLRVISDSPSNVQPVLDSGNLEHAARMYEAQIVDIILTENDKLRTAATFGQLGRLPDDAGWLCWYVLFVTGNRSTSPTCRMLVTNSRSGEN